MKTFKVIKEDSKHYGKEGLVIDVISSPDGKIVWGLDFTENNSPIDRGYYLDSEVS